MARGHKLGEGSGNQGQGQPRRPGGPEERRILFPVQQRSWKLNANLSARDYRRTKERRPLVGFPSPAWGSTARECSQGRRSSRISRPPESVAAWLAGGVPGQYPEHSKEWPRTFLGESLFGWLKNLRAQ